MKAKLLLFILAAFAIYPAMLKAQIPQALHFQAIARDASGNIIVKKNIQVRLSVIDSTAKKIDYQEIQAPILTDTFGYFDIKLNDSTNPDWNPSLKYGKFKNIPWAKGRIYLLIEYQAPGTFKYINIGEVQLITHPFAMVAQTTLKIQGFDIANAKDGDVIKYDSVTKTWKPANGIPNAGTGIRISNGNISNTAPDVPMSLSGGGKTTVSGKYPNFTVNDKKYLAGRGIRISNDSVINTAQKDTLSLAGAGSTTITGSSPAYNIISPSYYAGKYISLANDTISTFKDTATLSYPNAGYLRTIGGSLIEDTPHLSITVPSDGFYLLMGKTYILSNDTGTAVSYYSTFIYNKTRSTILTRYDMQPVTGYGDTGGNPRVVSYLHKGDKIELAFSASPASQFDFGWGDNLILVKLK